MRFEMRAAVLGLAVLLPSALLHAAERAVALHSDIRIAPDGALTVTETIEVQVDGRSLAKGEGGKTRRGLAREVAPAEVLAVTHNGHPVAYTVERLEKSTRVRTDGVGLQHGKHVYAMTYRAEGQVRFGERHDELSWNVAGGGWTVAFDRVTAEVSFAQPVPAASLQVQAYTGSPGARGRDYNALVRAGSAAFRTTRALQPGESMTIVVAFPKGIVNPPSLAARSRAFAAAHPAALAGGAGLLGLLLFLFVRRKSRKKTGDGA